MRVRAARIAGHVVGSLARGVGFKIASMQPSQQLLGVDDYFRVPSRFENDPGTTPIHQRWVEDRCIVVIAGPATVALLAPRADDKANAAACHDIALGLVRSIAPSDTLASLHLSWLEAIARDLVTIHRQTIEHIAGRLLAAGVLSGHECREVWRSFAAPFVDALPHTSSGALHWTKNEEAG
jgi:hypothetical protein